MPDAEGSLESERAAQAARSALPGFTRRLFAAAAAVLLGSAIDVSAQQPVVAKPPAEPEFFPRYDFHLNGAWLGETSEPLNTPGLPPLSAAAAAQFAVNHRYSFDTHWGGSFDFLDYVAGRTSFVADYEAIIGDEFRIFDPNQSIYTLEASSSARVGDEEIAVIYHHVSRHLSDRANRQAVAWNAAGARVLKRVQHDTTTIDIDGELSHVVAKVFVDYTWIAELHVDVQHPYNAHATFFVRGSGRLFAVDETAPQRGTQTGGEAEAGVRLKGNGRGGVLELFAGFEKRVDAYALERSPERWVLAGFRLLSR
jgi:hypothetical protein